MLFTIVNYALITFVNMDEFILNERLSDSFYEKSKCGKIEGRYLNYSHLEEILKNTPLEAQIETIGFSVKKEPIKIVRLGTGKIKVLAWSQMHGNETTTTKACLDFIFSCFNKSEDLLVKHILQKCTLHFILMLNPDGARLYTRENANNLDLNRDMQQLSQPESIALNTQFKRIKPDYCLNLHDQRTIFNAGNYNKPAILSFLAPAADNSRSLNHNRKIAMGLITDIKTALEKEIPEQIGRYDDSFNINCAGETFQSLGVPTLLFEAGHFPGDYKREKTRKLIFKALLIFFYQISSKSSPELRYNAYFDIPENKKLFNDVVLRNVLIDDRIKDISLQFNEVLKNGKIEFVPVVSKIAPKIANFGHKEIDCEGGEVRFLNRFSISENDIVDKIILNDSELMLKPE